MTFKLKKWFKVNALPLTTRTIWIENKSLWATGKRKCIPDMDLQRSTMALTFDFY